MAVIYYNGEAIGNTPRIVSPTYSANFVVDGNGDIAIDTTSKAEVDALITSFSDIFDDDENNGGE